MRVKFTDSKGQARVEEMVVLGGATTSDGSPAGLVVAEISVPKAPQVIPTISSVETAEIQIDVQTTAQIVGIRATANPPDTSTAGNRLMNSYPDTVLVGPDETIEIHSDTAITNVSIAAVANIAVTEAAYNAGTKTATGTIATSAVLADFVTILVPFDFNSVDAVNMVQIKLIPYSDGTTDKNLARFTIAGYSI